MSTLFSCSSSQFACIFLFVCYSLTVLVVSESSNFKISSFDVDKANVVFLSGDAVFSNGTIVFNRFKFRYHVGHAKYAEAVQIWDRKSGKISDFTTHFTFIIDTPDPSSYGHGFAFFLAPVGFQIPPNSGGPGLGLFNNTRELSRNQMIVVEFDSFQDKWDPPFRFGHVGINKNSIRSANYTAWNASLHNGDTADAWLSYNSTTHMLSLSWRYRNENSIAQENTSLSYQVDLSEVLPEWVNIGFSASTGVVYERQTLQYWEFNSSLNISKQSTKDTSNKRKLAVGLTIPFGVVVAGGIVAYAIFRKKSIAIPPDTVALTSINEDLERGAGPKRFSFRDLALATNNFSDDHKLGEGGFGCVYKGYLSHERIPVAVKKVSQGSKQGKKEYITEVKIISSLRHRNLVQLIGWCHDQTQFLLVYEFLPNGSLDSHLFYKKSSLEWSVRYKIAVGLASALLYLHEDCERCVVHRDIKTSNIMLDSAFNVKLGDFGLARLMDHELGLQTTGLAGTIGYMAPEYVTTGKASKEADVYSFGVVALEIACGRKAMDKVDPNSDLGLVHWVWGLLGRGELVSGADHMLNKEFDAKQVECLMMVGLWCAHPDSSIRPSIRQAIQVLKFETAVPNLPKKIPVPVYYAEPDAPEISSTGATITSTSIDLVR